MRTGEASITVWNDRRSPAFVLAVVLVVVLVVVLALVAAMLLTGGSGAVDADVRAGSAAGTGGDAPAPIDADAPRLDEGPGVRTRVVDDVVTRRPATPAPDVATDRSLDVHGAAPADRPTRAPHGAAPWRDDPRRGPPTA